MSKFDNDTEDEDSDIYLWLDYQDGEISEEEFKKRMYCGGPLDYDDNRSNCMNWLDIQNIHSIFLNKYMHYFKTLLSRLDKETKTQMPLYFKKLIESDYYDSYSFDDWYIPRQVSSALDEIYDSICDYILQRRIKDKICNLPPLPKGYEYAFDFKSYYSSFSNGHLGSLSDFIHKQKHYDPDPLFGECFYYHGDIPIFDNQRLVVDEQSQKENHVKPQKTEDYDDIPF